MSTNFEFQQEYIKDLEKVFNSDLDVDIKILSFDQSLEYLKEVVGTGKILVDNDFFKRVEFEFELAKQYADFSPAIDLYYQNMNDRIAKGNYATRHTQK